MKKTIAIVAGGDSSEHDVSLRSAEGIHSFLDKERYEVYIIEIKGMTWEAHLKDGSRSNVDRNDFSFMEGGKRIRPDFAYITIHGTPGENGILQGYFDLIHLPYSTSDVLVEAMTFNKFTLNQYLKGFGVSVSESLIVRKGFEHLITDDEIIEKIGLPCFVKPNAGGSSFGVTKVKSADQIHGDELGHLRKSRADGETAGDERGGERYCAKHGDDETLGVVHARSIPPSTCASTQMVAAVMPWFSFEMVGSGPRRLNTPWKRPL